MPGIESVEVLLGSDAFTVGFDATKVSTDRILAKIQELGYEPTVGEASSEETTVTVSGPFLEPVASALADAAKTGDLVLVDFHAEWCGPCKRLEREVLSTDTFREATRGIRVLRVDTDRLPEVAKQFGIVGLPTLVALDPQGEQLMRLTGSISGDDLIRRLTALRDASGKT